jgi:hypothetical protein
MIIPHLPPGRANIVNTCTGDPGTSSCVSTFILVICLYFTVTTLFLFSCRDAILPYLQNLNSTAGRKPVLPEAPFGCVHTEHCIFVRLSITCDVTSVVKETKTRNTVKHVPYCFQISSEFCPCRHRLYVHHFAPCQLDSEARCVLWCLNEIGIEMFYKAASLISHYSVHGINSKFTRNRRSVPQLLETVLFKRCVLVRTVQRHGNKWARNFVGN